MTNKILFSFLSLALVFGFVGVLGIQTAHAQAVPSFPTGCTSNLGYSVTSGAPCNGTLYATMNISGCTTALGYSVTTGTPCDGSYTAISYLAGCTSINGFSTISSAACDGSGVINTGSNVATTITTTPGLPVTGAGSNTFANLALLFSSAIIAIVGSTYFVKKYKMTV